MSFKLYSLVLTIAEGRLLALSHKYNKGCSSGACDYIFDQTLAGKRHLGTGSQREEKSIENGRKREKKSAIIIAVSLESIHG